MTECTGHVSKGKFRCDQDPEFIKCRNKAISMAQGFYNTFKDEKGKSFKVRVGHENLPLEKDNHNGVLYYDFNILIRDMPDKDGAVITVYIYFTESIYYTFSIEW